MVRESIVFCLLLGVRLGLAQGVLVGPPPLPEPPLIDVVEALRLAATATVGAYPDADQVLVADFTRIDYAPDGTDVEVNEEYTKVLTEKGKREGRTRDYGFMSHYERVHILCAEVIRPDGTRIPIDVAAQSREMVDPSQMGSNIFDPNSKVLSLTIPGLEIGDVRRLVVARTTTKARVPDTWSDYTVFEYSSPILSLVYEIQAPTARPLSVIRLRDELPDAPAEYVAEPNAAGILHRWTVRNVPQAFPEPDMPPLHTVVRRLLVSTIMDWRQISRWYWELCAPRIAATTDAMRTEVERLTEGAKTRDERIRRIFTFVSQEIRYMGVTPEAEAPGYEPHDVSMTFENRYGVCRDKAALLVAMLRMADIPAYPVIIDVGPRKDAEVPQPFFNHAIVAVERGEAGQPQGAARYQLMDPTDENTRDLLPGYLRNKSFLVAHPDGETLLDSGPAPAEDNLVRITTKGLLDSSDTLTLDATLVFEGVNDNAYRGHLLRLKPDERRRFFEGLVRARVAGAALTEFALAPDDLQDTAQPLTVMLRCVAPEYPVQGDGARIVGVPWLGTSVGFANWVLGRTGLEKRRFPLVTDPTCGVEESVRIALAGSPVPTVLPGATRRESRGLLFEQQVDVEDGHLLATARFLVREDEFSPSEYLALREDRKEMEYAARRRPVFEAGAGTDEADVRIVSNDTRIELADDGTWTTETRTRKRILTYAGKKANSELKLGFNPAWQTLEVSTARVTAPDGTVREAGAVERNLMDAAWVGGAPRYPAERTLVVSLPGVEVGSLVETTVRMTQQDAPFFSLRTAFQGLEPVEAASLEIVVPKGLPLHVREPVAANSIAVGRQQTEQADRTVTRWSVSGVRAIPPEDDLPPSWVFLPTLLASTGSWKDYGTALAGRIGECVRDQHAARNKALELTAGLTTARERVRAVRDDVARAIRVAGPEFTALPIRALTPADTTLRDGYGHRADQAILLLAMLDAVGVEAEPLLVAGDAPVLDAVVAPLRDCPQRAFYNTLLVRATVEDGEQVWLNDTDHYAELGTTPHEGRPCMGLDGTPGVVDVLDRFRERGDSEWTLDVAADGSARIVTERRFHGHAVNGFRRQYRELPPEERRRHQQELVSAISQAAVVDGALETDLSAYPGVLRLAVDAPRYAVREGTTLQLLLPGIDENVLGLRAEKRVSPLYRGRDSRFETTHSVRFPPVTGKLLIAPPSTSGFEFPGGLGSVDVQTTSRRLEDGRLEVRVRRSVVLKSTVASADLYPALLAMNRHLLHPRYRTLLVEVP